MNNKKTNETTLTHLTKRFVRLLNSNSERVINLNEASTRLSVAKRRIYDITNVLEGIGLLQKTSKNVTRWVDCPKESPFAAVNQPPTQSNTDYLDETSDSNNPALSNPELADLKQQVPGINFNGLPDAELLALVQTYQKLDEGIKQLESSIRQQMSVEGAYVTYHDFKSSFNDQTIIAVKAPPETWLEVNEHQQIAIKSEPGQKIEVYLYQHSTNSNNTSNQLSGTNAATQQQPQQQQQLQHVYQANVAPQTPPHHLQQSQPSNSTTNNSQPLDATFTNTNNLIGQQPQTYTSVSSDEGRGRSAMSTTDGVTYHDPTSGVSDTDHYYNDPTLSSALSGTISEDEDPFKPLVPFDGREEPHYNFVLNDDFPIASLFPEDNLGLL